MSIQLMTAKLRFHMVTVAMQPRALTLIAGKMMRRFKFGSNDESIHGYCYFMAPLALIQPILSG